jgi:hypothetical protein
MNIGGVVDYEAVLADLREKRSRIDAAIQGIETIMGLSSVSSEGNGNGPGRSSDESVLGPGAFLGMTIVDATVKYLKFKRQSQRTEEILKALTDGGIVLTGESPLNVVGSVLNRNFNSGGDVVKISRGVWALADWHPRLRKSRSEAKVVGTDDALATNEPDNDTVAEHGEDVSDLL